MRRVFAVGLAVRSVTALAASSSSTSLSSPLAPPPPPLEASHINVAAPRALKHTTGPVTALPGGMLQVPHAHANSLSHAYDHDALKRLTTLSPSAARTLPHLPARLRRAEQRRRERRGGDDRGLRARALPALQRQAAGRRRPERERERERRGRRVWADGGPPAVPDVPAGRPRLRGAAAGVPARRLDGTRAEGVPAPPPRPGRHIVAQRA